MTNWHKIGGTLLCSALLFGCLDKDTEVTVDSEGSIVRQTDAEIKILAPTVREIAEQTEHSVKAKVTATNGIDDFIPQVQWQIIDAPEGFAMELSSDGLVGEDSIVEFVTPDIDEDIQVTLRVSAELEETEVVKATTSFHDITLSLYANGEITISGAVVDEPIPGALVTIRVGDVTFEVTADENGLYSIPVEFADPNAVVEVTAVGAPGSGFEAVEFKSYLGDGSSLLADAGEDKELTPEENININVSNVTTAVYVLVQDVLEEQSEDGSATEGLILNQTQFDELVEQVDNEEVIQVAAVIQLVVDYGADLPENTNTVLDLVEELVKDEDAKNEFVEESIQQVVAENPEIEDLTLDDLVEDIIEDDNLVASPKELEFIDHFLVANTVRTTSTLFKSSKLLFGELKLNEGNTGQVTNFLTAGDRSLTWSVDGTQVKAVFDVEVVLSDSLYEVPEGYTLFITGFSINELAKSETERSWLVRVRGEYRNGNAAESQTFSSESVAITARSINNIQAYNDSLLAGTNRYLTIVDNTSKTAEQTLFNASSQLLTFNEDKSGLFTNANGQAIAFTWQIGDLGRLTVDIAGGVGVPEQRLTYARFKQATNSIAYISSMALTVDNKSYAFSDITYNPAEGARPDGFSFHKTYKTVGSEDSFTLLPDNTGFYYTPANATKFSHFTYSVAGDTVSITNYGNQRPCTLTAQCSPIDTAELSFDHFAGSRLTYHQSLTAGSESEGSLAIAKSVRDVVFTTATVPANLNLYLADTNSTHSFFFNADGTGLVNAGSTDGVCSAVTWRVSDEGRLVVNNGSDVTYRLLAGSLKQGLVWSGTGASGKLFSTTSNINSCAEASEQFIAIDESTMKFGNYRFTNNETGNRLVVRFNQDHTGYLVNGLEYYSEEYSQTIENYLKDITWDIDTEGRLVIYFEQQLSNGVNSANILLIEDTLTSGQVLIATDTNQDGTNDETVLYASSVLKGCNVDTDGDGQSNCFDKDDDGDGTKDSEDAFPLDASETSDFDKDGVGDNADTDDDNDNVLDENDADPYNPEVGESKEFTSAMITNKTLVETGVWRDGTLPSSAIALSFDTNTMKSSQSNGSNTNIETNYSWQINEGVLILTSDETNFRDWVRYPFEELTTRFQFSSELVEELKAAYESGEMSDDVVDIRFGKYRQEVQLVDDATPGRYDVAVQTEWQYRVVDNFDYQIQEDSSYIGDVQVSTAILFDTDTAITLGNSQAEGTGQWVLPHDYTLPGEIGYFSEYDIVADLFSLNNGEAAGEISGLSFSFSFDNGSLVLVSGQTSYTYTAVVNSGDVYLGVVTKQVGDVIENVWAQPFVKFDNSASTFIAGLNTEFPQVHLAHINSGFESHWDGDVLKLENVWGYRFGPNGHLDRGVSSVIGKDDPEVGFDYFNIGQEWNWLTSGTQLFMRYFEGDTEPKFERTWDIAATTTAGFTAVLERSTRTYDYDGDGQITADEKARWFILPRINYIKNDDLSVYQAAWANTQAMGTFSDADSDGDGIADNSDTDDDNDGYSDFEEIRLGTDPQDPNSNGKDFDNDGIVDSQDNDDDNDGVLDEDDIAPYNNEVGEKLTLDNSVLADSYLQIENSNMLAPNFDPEESGSMFTFDKTNMLFTFSDDEESEQNSYIIADDVLVVNLDDDSSRYDTDIWYLVELGIISDAQANQYIEAHDASNVFIEETYTEANLYLVAQNGDKDTFYVEQQVAIYLPNDWQRQALTGSLATDPIVVMEPELFELHRLDNKASLPFVASELSGTKWALPASTYITVDQTAINDDVVHFEATTYTAEFMDSAGTWSVNSAGQLVLVDGDNGDVFTYTRYAEFDSMAALHVTVETTLKDKIEGAWIDGTGGYTMPTPVASAGNNQVVIYYNREDQSFDGWKLHIWGSNECSGVVSYENNSTPWESGLEYDGIDPNFGAYWILDVTGPDACVNFMPHHYDNGWQTNDFTVYPNESDSSQFFVLGLDDNDAWNTTDAMPYARTFASLDIAEETDGTLSLYVYGGELDDTSTFAGIADQPLNFSWHLMDDESYDEFGDRINELFTYFVGTSDGQFVWSYGGYDLTDIPENQQWSIDASTGALLETYTVNRTDMSTSTCTIDNVDCVIHYQYRFTPITTVGNRIYFHGSYFYNPTAWQEVYDPAAIRKREFGINFAEIQDPAMFDYDLDGISDNWDQDSDGDGVANEDDAFPYDETEWADNDGDGMGNNADTDDDNDGVSDADDVDPNDPELGAKLAITTASIAGEHLFIGASDSSNPDFNTFMSFNGQRLSFTLNNEFAITDVSGSATSSYTINDNVISTSFNGAESISWYSPEMMVENGLISQQKSDEFVAMYGFNWVEFTVKVTGAEYMLVKETSDKRDFYATYYADFSPVNDEYREFLYGAVDAAPVNMVSSQYVAETYIESEMTFAAFNTADFNSSLVISGLPIDYDGDAVADDFVADLLDFTSSTSVTGATESFSWSIVNGELVITYTNGTVVTVKKHKQYDGAYSALFTTATNDMTYSRYALVSQLDTQVDANFIVDQTTLGASTLTGVNTFDEFGVISDQVFGFRLEYGGDARVLQSNHINEGTFTDINVGYEVETRNWRWDGDNIVIRRGYNEFGDARNCDKSEVKCNWQRERFWQPIRQTGDRLYVLEWEMQNNNYWNFDDPTPDWSMRIAPRLNFYELYPIEIDSDGDGTFDHADSDSDNDGWPNNDDHFPFDRDEHQDSDGDTVGDNRDRFPNDASEQFDNDNDGIGDNADPDDDNDGIDDVNDPSPYKDTRTVSMLSFDDSELQACLHDQYGDSYYYDVEWIDCWGYNITTLGGIEQLYNVRGVSFGYVNIEDYMVLQSLPNLIDFHTSDVNFDVADLGAIAAIDTLEALRLSEGDLTTLEPLRNHPTLNRVHLWIDSENLEMDVLLSLTEIKELAIRTRTVDAFDVLGQLTSLEMLWLHGDVSDQEASELGGLTNLTFLNIGWGENWSATALNSSVGNYSNLRELHVNSLILPDISFLQSFANFEVLTLENSSPVILSQMADLTNAGIDVNYWLNIDYVDENMVVGRHNILNVENDQGEINDIQVVFEADYTGSIDWGFGEETFTWSITDEWRIYLDYDNSAESDLWYLQDVNPNGNGYLHARLGIEIDYNSDGIYEQHSDTRFNIEKSQDIFVGKADVTGRHTFFDPNSNMETEITFNADGTGFVIWDQAAETFTWTFDAEGRVIVDYDDVNNPELDRWTWTQSYRDGAVYTSGEVMLEVSDLGDGNFAHTEFTGVVINKDIDVLSLVGTWILENENDPNDYNLLTFIDDHRYVLGHTKNTENEHAISGEYGVYSWNQYNGEFNFSKFGDSDGQGGLPTSGATIHYNGDEIILAAEGEPSVHLTRVTGSQKISGSWLIENSSEQYSVFTVVDETRYAIFHVNSLDVTIEVSGEVGNYVWNESDFLFSNTLIAESDSTEGFNALNKLLEVTNEVIQISTEDGTSVEAIGNRFDASAYRGDNLVADDFSGEFQVHFVDELTRHKHAFVSDGSGYAIWDDVNVQEAFNWTFDESSATLIVDYGNGDLEDLYHVVNYQRDDAGNVVAIDFAIEADDDGDGLYDTNSYLAIMVPDNQTFAMQSSDVIGTHSMMQLEDNVVVEIVMVFNDDSTGTAEYNGIYNFTWSLDADGAVIIHYDSEVYTDRLVWLGAFYTDTGELDYGIYELQIDNDGDGVYDEVDNSWYKTIKQ